MSRGLHISISNCGSRLQKTFAEYECGGALTSCFSKFKFESYIPFARFVFITRGYGLIIFEQTHL